jgi:signal peptidase II
MSSGDEPHQPTALPEVDGVLETTSHGDVGSVDGSPSAELTAGLDVTAPASTLTIREASESAAIASFDVGAAVDVPPASAPIERPTFVFLGVVSALTLASDVTSKAWAEVAMNRRGFEPIDLIGNNLSITLAYNKGGAWGMFQDAGEMVRKPFFICVSLAAIWFIVSLYARLSKSQKALTWGLPLVLGGALGNLSDRITRSQVIDFIDYRADWVMRLNAWIRQYSDGWAVTDHWPTFNVADIAICIGVGLMAVDMYTSRRRPHDARPEAPAPPATPPSDLASFSA